MTVKVVLAEAHKEQIEDKELKREVEDIQKYFDDNSFKFTPETVNFVFLRGIYRSITKSMLVVGVFVNNTGDSIAGLAAKLQLQFKNRKAVIGTTTMALPPDFLGEIKDNEGFILHIEIPVEGLEKDEQFGFSDVQGSLDEVEIVRENNEKL